MDLKKYFNEHTGTGVLATADSLGNVNTAIYARPHVLADSTLGFIMRKRLSRKNILENGHAGYLFHEDGRGHSGIRLRLKFLQEFTDHELLSQPSRSPAVSENHKKDEPRYLATFAVEHCLALVGSETIDLG